MEVSIEKIEVPAVLGKITQVPLVDTTLTKSGYSADAKVVGDRLDKVSAEFAKNVKYDNTNSKLNATDIQGAIDETNEKLKIGGWINANLQTPFESFYGTSPNRYRKVGNVVEIVGIVSVTSELESSNAQHTIFTLDSGYRPLDTLSIICQGSGVESWLLTVNADGKVCASRYRDANGYKKFGVGIWMPYHMTYLVN